MSAVIQHTRNVGNHSAILVASSVNMIRQSNLPNNQAEENPKGGGAERRSGMRNEARLILATYEEIRLAHKGGSRPLSRQNSRVLRSFSFLANLQRPPGGGWARPS